MGFPRSRGGPRSSRLLAGCLLVVLTVNGARHVAASTCRPDPLTLVDSTTGSIDTWTACACIDHPKCQRPRIVRVVEWRGTPYLLIGRDRSVWFASLEDAARPGILQNASVGISEVGDDEATIRNVVACGDCRVAMLAGRADSAVWQWGDGDPLQVDVGTPWRAALGAAGGFTWREGGTQYLVTDRLSGDVAGCHPSATTSAPVVYRVAPGPFGPTWQRVGCADAGGTGWQVFDGELVGGEAWLRAATGQVYRFALEGGGRLRYVEPDPIRGAREGFGVHGGVFAAVSPSGSTPVSLASVSDPASVVATVPDTVGHQVLALGHGAILSSDLDGASLHSLSDLQRLAEVPNGVTAACEETSSIAFHPTEPVAYLARVATLQAVDLGSCLPGPPPRPLFADGFESGDAAAWTSGG